VTTGAQPIDGTVDADAERGQEVTVAGELDRLGQFSLRLLDPIVHADAPHEVEQVALGRMRVVHVSLRLRPAR